MEVSHVRASAAILACTCAPLNKRAKGPRAGDPSLFSQIGLQLYRSTIGVQTVQKVTNDIYSHTHTRRVQRCGLDKKVTNDIYSHTHTRRVQRCGLDRSVPWVGGAALPQSVGRGPPARSITAHTCVYRRRQDSSRTRHHCLPRCPPHCMYHHRSQHPAQQGRPIPHPLQLQPTSHWAGRTDCHAGH